MSKVFYPSCQWLDPNTRDTSRRFYCERRRCYVEPARTVYTKERRFHLFHADRCAPDCWNRRGKTRVPVL